MLEEGESLELSPQDRSILAGHFRAMGVDRDLAAREAQFSGGRVVDLSSSLMLVNGLAEAGAAGEVVGDPLQCAPGAELVNCVARKTLN